MVTPNRHGQLLNTEVPFTAGGQEMFRIPAGGTIRTPDKLVTLPKVRTIYYADRCRILRRFLCSLRVRFLRHFQRIAARAFL